MGEPVTIVGGGLAGLTLAIGLRQRDVPVTVWEAGRYPRHRVCGEFISGRGLSTLQRLGLDAHLKQSGLSAGTAAFFNGSRPLSAGRLPEPALCVSRFVLDHALAREFQRLGGTLREAERWKGGFPEAVVRATGRRPHPADGGWRLFGLKIHTEGVPLQADLEMHLVPSGYVGLCRLPDGMVNICGLFRSAATVPDLAKTWPDWLGGPKDSVLHSRLASATFDPQSLSTVAGISLNPRRAIQHDECSLGDSLTMIPPVTGNGMSMAFESAELAIGPLAQFSRGKITWPQARHEIAKACDSAFSARLRWAAWVQFALFNSAFRRAVNLAGSRSLWVWQSLFNRTR